MPRTSVPRPQAPAQAYDSLVLPSPHSATGVAGVVPKTYTPTPERWPATGFRQLAVGSHAGKVMLARDGDTFAVQLGFGAA